MDICSSLVDFSDMDNSLVGATVESLKSGTLMPLIKEELRLKIQSRRLGEGKDELEVTFEQPIKPVLTDDEKRRKEERKVKNREAANRSRARKRKQKEQTVQDMRILQEKNKELKEVVQKLESEKSSLQKLLHNTSTFHVPSHKDMQTSWDDSSKNNWDTIFSKDYSMWDIPSSDNYPCSPLRSSTDHDGSRPCSPEDGIVPGSQPLTNLYNSSIFLTPCSLDKPISGPSSCESGFTPSPSPTLDEEKNSPWWLQNIQ
ncbi:hypothetical protein ACJMK2_037212 [Sinanodonta woodiana]|uniref:BZIP domain-containing protein n=1 Tax=Sinanodonta woodiana TaxID=1069815 RepID=A0ABD3WJM0_SINWO